MTATTTLIDRFRSAADASDKYFTFPNAALLLQGNAEDLLPLFPEVEPRESPTTTILTDPPYGIEQDYGTNVEDLRPPAHVWSLCYSLAHSLHLTVSVRHMPNWLESITGAGWEYRHTSVYYNMTRTCGNFKGLFAYVWEPVLHFARKPFKLRKRMWSDVFPHTGRRTTDCRQEREQNVWRELADILPGDIFIDPYMGVGTSAIAALDTGRSFVGIELNPDRWAAAVLRVRNYLHGKTKMSKLPKKVTYDYTRIETEISDRPSRQP